MSHHRINSVIELGFFFFHVKEYLEAGHMAQAYIPKNLGDGGRKIMS